MKHVLATRLAAAVAVVCMGDSSAALAAADHIFLNAKAYTLNAASSWAEAVAVEGSRIVYVGDNAGAKALSGKGTRT